MPLQRTGTVAEHAWLVALLASPLGRAFNGSTVTLVVSGGPGQVAVPDVVDKGLKEAKRMLKEAGLKTATREQASQSVALWNPIDLGYSATEIAYDLVKGAEAKPGGTVTVHYLGVDYENGEEFDSSWSRGQSISFPLGNLIKGWQDGIPGMKVGGRRKLTVPPALAYGPAGGGHPLSGKTLIFVIDLLGVS